MSAQNMYGKCRDSQVWTTVGDTSISGTFRDAVGAFPVIGGFVSGFISDPTTLNAIRQCPGAVTDYTTPYRQTYVLAGVVVALLVLFLMIPSK